MKPSIILFYFAIAIASLFSIWALLAYELRLSQWRCLTTLLIAGVFYLGVIVAWQWMRFPWLYLKLIAAVLMSYASAFLFVELAFGVPAFTWWLLA